MHDIIDIQTGGVAVGVKGTNLKSSGIGSCVVIVLLDIKQPLAGIAHTMLPNRCPAGGTTEKTRYVEDALDVLLGMIVAAGGNKKKLVACIVGGANVLKRGSADICDHNIDSARKGLSNRGIDLVAQDVGGIDRRKVSVDIATGVVLSAKGDGEEKLLFRLGDYLGS